MRRIGFFLILLMVVVSMVQAQTQSLPQKQTTISIDDDYVISIGLSGGVCQGINAYRTTTDASGFNYTANTPSFNIAANVGVFVTNKFRPRLELAYVKSGYGTNWPNSYVGFTRTNVHLASLDLSLHLDYSILNISRLQIYASPAFKSEFLAEKGVRTTYSDGDWAKKSYFNIDKNHHNDYYGAAFSMIFIYKVTSQLGVTLTPEYTYFFSKYVNDNSKAFQRFTGNIGVEYKF